MKTLIAALTFLFIGLMPTVAYPEAFVGAQPVCSVDIVASSTNIPTSSYVQLCAAASVTIPTTTMQCYNSTTQILQLGIGGSGVEVAIPYILGPTAFMYTTHLSFGAGTRIAVKAIGTAATTGVLVCNFLR